MTGQPNGPTMPSLKSRLEALTRLHEKAGAHAVLDEVAIELAEGRRRRPLWFARRMNASALFAVASVATVLVISIPLILISLDGGTGDTPLATALPPPTAVATTAAVPTTGEVAPDTTTPSTPADLEMTWVQAPVQEAFGLRDGIWKVIEGGPGLIAVGAVKDSTVVRDVDVGLSDAAVWVSADGLNWEKVGDPDVFGGVPTESGNDKNQVIQDVAAGPGGYVAVGGVSRDTGDVDPPIWFSPDGFEWERITGYGETFAATDFASVVADDTGFVAFGNQVWRSPDGRTWTRIDQEGLFPIDAGPVITTGSGYAVAGVENVVRVPPEGEGRYWGDPYVAMSSDGVTWTKSSLLDELGWAWELGLVGDRFVVSVEDASGWALWASDDGESWERLSNITGRGRNHYPLAPVADGDRWVLGSMEWTRQFTNRAPWGAALVFVSNDGGATWHEVATLGQSPEGQFEWIIDQGPPGIRSLIRFGDLFVAVGGTGNGSAPVWTGTWNN